jgi:hypothetical protein
MIEQINFNDLSNETDLSDNELIAKHEHVDRLVDKYYHDWEELSVNLRDNSTQQDKDKEERYSTIVMALCHYVSIIRELLKKRGIIVFPAWENKRPIFLDKMDSDTEQ